MGIQCSLAGITPKLHHRTSNDWIEDWKQAVFHPRNLHIMPRARYTQGPPPSSARFLTLSIAFPLASPSPSKRQPAAAGGGDSGETEK